MPFFGSLTFLTDNSIISSSAGSRSSRIINSAVSAVDWRFLFDILTFFLKYNYLVVRVFGNFFLFRTICSLNKTIYTLFIVKFDTSNKFRNQIYLEYKKTPYVPLSASRHARSFTSCHSYASCCFRRQCLKIGAKSRALTRTGSPTKMAPLKPKIRGRRFDSNLPGCQASS